MIDEQNKAVRNRDEQAKELASTLQEDPWMYFPAQKYAEEMLQEAEARGAAEQGRKDAEGSRSVHQWRLTADDEWVNAVDLVELEQVRNGYPNSETRTLYTRPANVAALEAALRAIADRADREGATIDDDECAAIARAAITREGGV